MPHTDQITGHTLNLRAYSELPSDIRTLAREDGFASSRHRTSDNTQNIWPKYFSIFINKYIQYS